MAGKYTPLENYLRNLPKTQNEVTLDFEQIERILNNRLPPSAYDLGVQRPALVGSRDRG